MAATASATAASRAASGRSGVTKVAEGAMLGAKSPGAWLMPLGGAELIEVAISAPSVWSKREPGPCLASMRSITDLLKPLSLMNLMPMPAGRLAREPSSVRRQATRPTP